MMGRLFAIVALLFGMSGILSARPFITLFGSEECDDCAEFKELYREEMTAPEDPVMVYVCVDGDTEYLFLKKVEQALKSQNPSSQFPVVLAGEHFLYGIDSIRENFEELLDWATEVAPIPEMEGIRRAAEASGENYTTWLCATNGEDGVSADVAQFDDANSFLLYLETSAACRHCERQSRELEVLKAAFPALEITQAEVSTPEGQMLYQRFLKHFALPDDGNNLAPLIAWNDGYVSGELATSEMLADVLKNQGKASAFWVGEFTAEEKEALGNRQRTFLDNATWGTTILAGLLDGINPCAFATAIFLISYLLYLKKNKHFVLAVGLCFCLGVFIAYVLFGVGLSVVMDFLTRFALVKILLYGLFALAGVVLFVLHLRDALRYRKTGNVASMEMGLDAQKHRKIHDRIKKWSKISSAVAFPAAVLLGCVVSSMEFVCTGQIYLPTLMAINSAGFNLRAFMWLLLYNCAFILPLVAVSILAYYGVGAQALAKWAKDNVFLTKILMSILFLLLAILMVCMIF